MMDIKQWCRFGEGARGWLPPSNNLESFVLNSTVFYSLVKKNEKQVRSALFGYHMAINDFLIKSNL